MVQVQVQVQDVVKFVSQVLTPARVGSLEKNIIEYSYLKKSYQLLVADCDYNENYTLRAANSLWKDLSQKLQEPVNKSNFTEIITQKLLTQQNVQPPKPP